MFILIYLIMSYHLLIIEPWLEIASHISMHVVASILSSLALTETYEMFC